MGLPNEYLSTFLKETWRQIREYREEKKKKNTKTYRFFIKFIRQVEDNTQNGSSYLLV